MAARQRGQVLRKEKWWKESGASYDEVKFQSAGNERSRYRRRGKTRMLIIRAPVASSRHRFSLPTSNDIAFDRLAVESAGKAE